MKKELIAELLEKFEHACYLYNGTECRSARELKPEALPPSEDVKKVQRKTESEERKMLKEIKKEKK